MSNDAMRVVLTPTISIDLPIDNTQRKGNIMSDMNKRLRLININTEREVNMGDVVRYSGKPCYVEKFNGVFVWVVTMDERRLSIKLLPRQLGCLVDTTEGVQA